MESTPARKPAILTRRDRSGIALFMVLTAISVLSIVVTEFTYIAQMNEKLAFDGVDQVKAHYLAKTGLKLSLLRLKAFQTVKSYIGANKAMAAAVPKAMLDEIWSFPFIYPIPTTIPGLSMGDKDQIEKFQKSSTLDGSFTATIESASAKYDLNSILPGNGPDAGPSPSPSSSPAPSPSAGPSPSPYNPDQARQSLSDYLMNLFNEKSQNDDNFTADERDFRIDDFMDNVVGWADPTYEPHTSQMQAIYPVKRAPFYSLTEMHMLPGMDDELYDLFAPALTANRTAGININTMQAATLQALVPLLTPDEVSEFFKFRDDPTQDNTFQSPGDFFKYLSNSTGAYRSQTAIQQLQTDLQNRNITLIVDESDFKITVMATVNNSTEKLEAWVTTYTPTSNPTTGGTAPGAPPPATPPGQPAANPQQNPEQADPGLRITFMRIE